MASVIRSSVDFSAEMFGDDEYRGNLADQPGTPPLSLPDSFDNGYDAPAGFGGSSNRGGYTSDAKLQAEVNRVMGLMQERTGAFRDLSISEGMYNDFRLRPETDLSTYELAQLKCHEFKRSTRKETEQLRRTLQETQALLVAAEHRAEEATNTLARQSKMTKLDLDSTYSMPYHHQWRFASLESSSSTAIPASAYTSLTYFLPSFLPCFLASQQQA
jgi:hypothetical protein